jgi:uncharacterized membrane protein HdeD (DUF308 family)
VSWLVVGFANLVDLVTTIAIVFSPGCGAWMYRLRVLIAVDLLMSRVEELRNDE